MPQPICTLIGPGETQRTDYYSSREHPLNDREHYLGDFLCNVRVAPGTCLRPAINCFVSQATFIAGQ